jgi:hypothetical protein
MAKAGNVTTRTRSLLGLTISRDMQLIADEVIE